MPQKQGAEEPLGGLSEKHDIVLQNTSPGPPPISHLGPVLLHTAGSPPAVLTLFLPDRVGMLLQPKGAEHSGHAQAEQRMFVWFP